MNSDPTPTPPPTPALGGELLPSPASGSAPPGLFSGVSDPPYPAAELSHVVGWSNWHWALFVGALVVVPVVLIALMWWATRRIWDASGSEAAIVGATAVLAVGIPAVHVVVGFPIARHCTSFDYAMLAFGAALIAQGIAYGIAVRQGFIGVMFRVVGRVAGRDWRHPSPVIYWVPPLALLVIDIALLLVDAFHRAAAALGVSVGGLALLVLGVWAWLFRDDDVGRGSSRHYLERARTAAFIGNNNTIVQGDISGTDFHFR